MVYPYTVKINFHVEIRINLPKLLIVGSIDVFNLPVKVNRRAVIISMMTTTFMF